MSSIILQKSNIKPSIYYQL